MISLENDNSIGFSFIDVPSVFYGMENHDMEGFTGSYRYRSSFDTTRKTSTTNRIAEFLEDYDNPGQRNLDAYQLLLQTSIR